MNRNVTIAVVAVIVLVLIVWIIPWGGQEETVVETAEEPVVVTSEPDAAEGAADMVAEPEGTEAETEVIEDVIEAEGDVEVVPGGVVAEDAAPDSPAEPEAGVGPDVTTEIEQQESPEGQDETSTDAAADTAADLATDGVDSASEARMIDLEGALQVLSAENFDYDETVALVEGSEGLDADQKTTLLAGLDAARDDPEALAEVLERIRETLTAAREDFGE